MTDVAPGWYVYVLRSTRRAVTYVGISRDVESRLAQHNGELPGGAKSTRAGRPWEVARREGPFTERARAQAIEWAIKRRSGDDRLTVPIEAVDHSHRS